MTSDAHVLEIGKNLVGFFEGPFLWQSPPRTIGKTRWIYAVYTHSYYGAVTGFFWFDPHYYGGFWRPDKEHPRYNAHDGVYAGLPHGLVSIYRDHESSIKLALDCPRRAEADTSNVLQHQATLI